MTAELKYGMFIYNMTRFTEDGNLLEFGTSQTVVKGTTIYLSCQVVQSVEVIDVSTDSSIWLTGYADCCKAIVRFS